MVWGRPGAQAFGALGSLEGMATDLSRQSRVYLCGLLP